MELGLWHVSCIVSLMTGDTKKGTATEMQDSQGSKHDEDSSHPPESARREASGDLTEQGQRVQDMLAEGGGVVEPDVSVADELENPEPESTAERPERKILGWLEDFSHKWGAARLKTLVKRKGRLSKTMGALPESMHRVANQSRLALELIDDFRDGTYRQISWRSVALLVGGLVYAVSPADAVSDVIPVVGQLDDLVLLAVVARLVQGDLRKYCQFKGYDESEYFGTRRK